MDGSVWLNEGGGKIDRFSILSVPALAPPIVSPVQHRGPLDRRGKDGLGDDRDLHGELPGGPALRLQGVDRLGRRHGHRRDGRCRPGRRFRREGDAHLREPRPRRTAAGEHHDLRTQRRAATIFAVTKVTNPAAPTTAPTSTTTTGTPTTGTSTAPRSRAAQHSGPSPISSRSAPSSPRACQPGAARSSPRTTPRRRSGREAASGPTPVTCRTTRRAAGRGRSGRRPGRGRPGGARGRSGSPCCARRGRSGRGLPGPAAPRPR